MTSMLIIKVEIDEILGWEIEIGATAEPLRALEAKVSLNVSQIHSPLGINIFVVTTQKFIVIFFSFRSF